MRTSSMEVRISADPHWIDTAGALAERMGAYLGLPPPEAREAREAVIAIATIIVSSRWNGAAGRDLEMAFREGPCGFEASIRYVGGPSPDQLRRALDDPQAGGTAAGSLRAMDTVEVHDDSDSRVCLICRRLPEP